MKSSVGTAYVGLFLSGIASAATAPYLSTVALDTLGISGATYSTIVFVSGILSVSLSLAIGWASDAILGRGAIIAVLGIVAGAGIGAFVIFGTVALFLLCCLLFLPLTSILTQQLFGYLRFESLGLDKLEIENRNARGRTLFATAWVAAPSIFLLLPALDPSRLAFATSAVACIMAALLFCTMRPIEDSRASRAPIPHLSPPATPLLRIIMLLIIPILGCGVLRAAPRLQQILLGPIVTQQLHGAFSEIGYIAAFTALIELPLILMWGRLLRYISRPAMLLIGSMLFSTYFVTLYLASSMTAIYFSSAILALATSGTLSITISYLQNLLPDRPGLGSSLISVANCIGVAVAALTFAPFSQTKAFSDCAIVAAIIVALGGLAIWMWGKRTPSANDG
ncbi:MFS transporter [Agrobacterium rosae]|uniref:MFS transporter n=1 Tax=Agrobacterium rosae TaxID=1972867 RepID=UPI003B9E161F